jgi:peptidoglycan L-alanyl-D-glutamate endopeptidase CwlK
MATKTLSDRSLKRLEGVNPILVQVVKRAIELSKVDFMVIEGLRSVERQKQLYSQGRTAPGKKVTWTLKSKHIDGQAVDIAPVNPDGSINWTNLKLFDEMAFAMFRAANEVGVKIKWGADWDMDGVYRESGESDSPHFELA